MEIKNNKGFTMVELLVALAIFGMFTLSITSTALSIIKAQRKTFSLQNIQETGRYVLEATSKEIRTGVINSVSDDKLTLNITNAKGETFDYQFDDSNKQLLRRGQAISSSHLEVTGAFYVREYDFPARAVVTIVIKLASVGGKIEEQSEINLQSTIALR